MISDECCARAEACASRVQHCPECRRVQGPRQLILCKTKGGGRSAHAAIGIKPVDRIIATLGLVFVSHPEPLHMSRLRSLGAGGRGFASYQLNQALSDSERLIWEKSADGPLMRGLRHMAARLNRFLPQSPLAQVCLA